jgi:tetratricopeptide (TPR) repeat protein
VSWDIAVESIKNNFFFGSGPGTYGYDFSLFKPQHYNENAFYELRFFQGTGAVLESISTIVVLGTFFFLIIILSYLSVGFYLISREKEKNKLYSLGFFSASLITLLNVLTMKTEGTILILSALLGTLALSALLIESETQPRILRLTLKASPKFALTLAFIFMVISAGVAFLFVFLGKVYVADFYAGGAMRLTGDNKYDKAVVQMGKAVGMNKKESAYLSKLGEYYMVMANKEALKTGSERDIELIKIYLNASVDLANKAKRLSVNDIGAVETLAVIYENSGLYISDSLNQAEISYQKALELDPHNPNLLVKLGQVKVAKASNNKDENERSRILQEAKELFKKSIGEKSNLAMGYYQLALVQDALKEQDAAIDNMIKAVNFEKNDKKNEYLLALANMYRFRAKDSDVKDAIQILKYIIQSNEKNMEAHFYLGLAYEKDKNNDAAGQEYRRVLTLLGSEAPETKKQVEKMIENVGNGIENTPESLGLSKPSKEKVEEISPESVPASGQ